MLFHQKQWRNLTECTPQCIALSALGCCLDHAYALDAHRDAGHTGNQYRNTAHIDSAVVQNA